MLASVAATGCSAGMDQGTDAEVSQEQEPIVRARADGGKDQVVLLYIQTRNPTTGGIGTRSCSGTYFSDRVVLTAAHCLTNAWGNQVFAYFGENFAADLAALPNTGPGVTVPAPGSTAPWAQADSYETHPKWNAAQNYPDIAVVYLDRKLPFKPMPLASERIDDCSMNRPATLMGWGASQSLTADISQTVGGRVERTGTTRILGSPTLADYHPEDPNPGILVPSIRRDLLKTDGHAPYSNTCAGDSGSPLIVKEDGRDVVAGVSSWTGLWCEDYSLFTRLDPFTPFLNKATQKTGAQKVAPHLNCVAGNSDGSLSAYFGYQNDNGIRVSVPYGANNSLTLDSSSRRPADFLPGAHEFVFGVEFKANQSLTYKLASPSGSTTTIKVDKKSPRCGADVAPQVACGGFCRAGFAAGCTDALPSDTQCISDCLSLDVSFPNCVAEITAMNQCYAATPPGMDHWMCNGDDFMPSSFDCGDAENAFFNCLSQ